MKLRSAKMFASVFAKVNNERLAKSTLDGTKSRAQAAQAKLDAEE